LITGVSEDIMLRVLSRYAKNITFYNISGLRVDQCVCEV